MSIVRKIRNTENEGIIVLDILPENIQIREEIRKTREELECAYMRFQNVVVPELIDSCIYEIKALQIKYDYFVGLLKENREDAIG